MPPKYYSPDDLYTKYPKLFPKNSITCEIGWLNIVADMCAAIDIYLQYGEGAELPQVEFTEIKDKYGVLSISFTGGDDVVKHIASYCERLSYRTCSCCGVVDATLFCSTKWRDWGTARTLCEKHAHDLFYYRLT